MVGRRQCRIGSVGGVTTILGVGVDGVMSAWSPVAAMATAAALQLLSVLSLALPADDQALACNETMYASRMHTSMRVTPENRDSLARIATTELGGVSLDEALRVVLFEHQSRAALARLATDPDAAGSYLAETAKLAEVDTAVQE
jgi:hypothetical protein